MNKFENFLDPYINIWILTLAILIIASIYDNTLYRFAVILVIIKCMDLAIDIGILITKTVKQKLKNKE